VTVQGEFGGETTYSGFGAGGDPTAVAVVSDLMSIGRAGLGAEIHLPDSLEGQVGVGTDFTAAHYVRFKVADKPGILAALANVFSRHEINVDAVLQRAGHSKSALPFVITLEHCRVEKLRAALGEIRALDFHVAPPFDMPILD